MLGNGPRYFRPVMYISVELIFLPLNMKVESMSCGNPLFRFFVTLLQVLWTFSICCVDKYDYSAYCTISPLYSFWYEIYCVHTTWKLSANGRLIDEIELILSFIYKHILGMTHVPTWRHHVRFLKQYLKNIHMHLSCIVNAKIFFCINHAWWSIKTHRIVWCTAN